MKKLTKNNLNNFLEYYHNLHDSSIKEINYDIEKLQIEIVINVFWSGKPKLKNDGTYETNKTKLKMQFIDVEKYMCKELFVSDSFTNIYLKFIYFNNHEYICFANEENDPLFYIISNEVSYEEI